LVIGYIKVSNGLYHYARSEGYITIVYTKIIRLLLSEHVTGMHNDGGKAQEVDNDGVDFTELS